MHPVWAVSEPLEVTRQFRSTELLYTEPIVLGQITVRGYKSHPTLTQPPILHGTENEYRQWTVMLSGREGNRGFGFVLAVCYRLRGLPKAVTMGRFECLNATEISGKIWRTKCRLKLIIMTKGSKLSTAYSLFLWQKLLPGDVFYRLGNAPKSAGALPRTPPGKLIALPRPSSWWEGAGCPPQEPYPRLSPSGLWLRPYGPRCLVPHTPQKINSYGLGSIHLQIQ